MFLFFVFMGIRCRHWDTKVKYKVRGFSHKEDIKGKLGLGSDLGSDISSQNACWQRKVIKNGAI